MNIKFLLGLVAVALSFSACDQGYQVLFQGPPEPLYNITVELEGIPTGATITFTLNNDEQIALTDNGSFDFGGQLPDGTAYKVDLAGVPPYHKCEVVNDQSTINGADVLVEAECFCDHLPTMYTDPYLTNTTTGSSLSPFIIATADQILHMSTSIQGNGDLGKSFIQVCDIDMSSVNFTSPIGVDAANAFTGAYDGGGYKISNLSASPNAGSDYQAMFGYLDGATLKNMFIDSFVMSTDSNYSGVLAGSANNGTVLENIAIFNSELISSAGQNIGALAGGTNDVSISKINVEGMSISSTDLNTGGLVGEIRSSTLDTIRLADITVESSSNRAGSLAGDMLTPGGPLPMSSVSNLMIINSDITGVSSVSGIASFFLKSNIENSYIAFSNVTADSATAGAFDFFDIGTNSVSVDNLFVSVNVNAVSGGDFDVKAGLASITNSFYDDSSTCSVCSNTSPNFAATTGISTLIDGSFAGVSDSSVWCVKGGTETPSLINIPNSDCP